MPMVDILQPLHLEHGSGQKKVYHLVADRSDVYHPSFAGTLVEALMEAFNRAVALGTGITIMYGPPKEPMSRMQSIAYIKIPTGKYVPFRWWE